MCRSTRRAISLLVVLVTTYCGLLSLSASSSRARSNSISSDLRIAHIDVLIGRIPISGNAAWQPTAPHFVEASASGLTYAAEQFRGGTLLVVVLDAGPARRKRQAIPQASSEWLQRARNLHERFGARGLNVVAITAGNRSYARKLSQEVHDDIPVLYDVSPAFNRAWRISPVQTPRAFLVDKRGRIVRGHAPWAVDRTPEIQAQAMSAHDQAKRAQKKPPAPTRRAPSMTRVLSSKALEFLGLGGIVSTEPSSIPAAPAINGAPGNEEMPAGFGKDFMPTGMPSGSGLPSGAMPAFGSEAQLQAKRRSSESSEPVKLDNRTLPPWEPGESELVEVIKGLYLEFAAPELLIQEARRLYPDVESITLAPVYQIGTGLFRVKDADGLFLGYLRVIHEDIQCPLCRDPQALVAVRADGTLDMELLHEVESWGQVRDTEHFLQQVRELQRDRHFSLSFTQHRANEDRLLQGMDMVDGISGATSTSHSLLNALQQTVRMVLRLEHPHDSFVQAKYAEHRPF